MSTLTSMTHKVKTILIWALATVSLQSCVSAKLYEGLQQEHRILAQQHQSALEALDVSHADHLGASLASEKALALCKEELMALMAQENAVTQNLARLQRAYDALAANSAQALSDNLAQNQDLLAELSQKEAALNAEASRLAALEKTIDERTAQIDELNAVITAKDRQMNALKAAISDALTQFEGKGLTVEQRSGKVYVSMENKLLFASGSWAVNDQGQKAVEAISRVLGDNKDILVLIEGHTDAVAYSGQGHIENNWDLSTKRATAIVTILSQNSDIDPSRLTAAGRSMYAPLGNNATPEGRAKNRRIELVLTPRLDALTELLESH